MADTIVYAVQDRLYLNITDQCNLCCPRCPVRSGSRRVGEYDLSLEQPPSVDEIIAAAEHPQIYQQVVFSSFGEPTLRLKEMLEVAQHIKQQGGEVRLNTDGLANLIHRRNVLPELARHIDAVSVFLNAPNAALYEYHCEPKVQNAYPAVMDFLHNAPRYVEHVSASADAQLEPGALAACQRIASSLGIRFHSRPSDSLH